MKITEINQTIRRVQNFILGVRSYPSPTNSFRAHCEREANRLIDQIAALGLFAIAADLAAQLAEAA